MASRGPTYASAVVYLTTQAHHCIEKALRIAGLGEAQIRHIADRRALPHAPRGAASRPSPPTAPQGLKPWLIVAAAGTTDTGAVDPLDAIATHRRARALLVPRRRGVRRLLPADRARPEPAAGIERSDSVVLDPHKSLLPPLGLRHRGACGTSSRSPPLTLLRRTTCRTPCGSPARSPPPTCPRAVEALPGAAHVAAADPPGDGALPGGARREAAARPLLPPGDPGPRLRGRPAPDLSIVTFAGPRRRQPGRGQSDQPGDRRRRCGGTAGSSSPPPCSTAASPSGMAALSFRTHRRTIDLALRILREQAAAVSG